MHIQNLSLIGFKNYDELNLEFSEGINCFVGPNGSGKTNILDAIHYLSLTKSAFNSLDKQNIKLGQKLFSVKGFFLNDDREHEVLCALQLGVKKILKIDKKEYSKLSEHVGKFPIVLIEPNDTDLIRGGSELRRRFFDTIISQTDSSYLQNLIAYNSNLKQRNALLKLWGKKGGLDLDLLEPYNLQLLRLGADINAARSSFVQKFEETFTKKYEVVSQSHESVGLDYVSDFNKDDIETRFRNSFQRELIMERTLMGVHKDDYDFSINNEAIRKFGSQGQQKSYVIALKLAHFSLVFENKGFRPILLLDDIFDKLDAGRVGNLINLIIKDNFGQIFITDAQQDRVDSILNSLSVDRYTFKVNNGEVKRLS